MSDTSRHPLITGTVILTGAGLISRIIGFFYRIFLSHIIGAEGLGIYQLIFPVYAFCLTLTVSGIQTAVSRCSAAAYAEKSPRKAMAYFSSGFCCSFLLSVIAAWFLRRYSSWLCLSVLKESRCEPMVLLIAYSIPLSSIHACISAFYFSRKKAGIPAISQLIEQFFRVAVTYLVYLIFLEKGLKPAPILAAAGILAGESASSLFSVICFLLRPAIKEISPLKSISRLSAGWELMKMSFPLTANRLLVTMLQSSEAILIPWHLRKTGMSSSQALAIYGILTGMSLPFILFPSVITNSVSTMLLPAIAGEQARGNQAEIKKAAEQTIKYCLILGIFAAGIFFFFGNALGMLVYHNKDAGTFICILSFLCPFLYLTGTLSSILNGLGHTFLCFLQNTTGLLIRIGFVVFAIPRFGITGYLWGLLFSQLTITLLNMIFIHRKVAFHLDSFQWILLPFFSLVISCGFGLFVFNSFSSCSFVAPLLVLGISLLLSGITYFICLIITGIIHIDSITEKFRKKA
jgi:stage V sporulation protein B